MDIKNNFEFDSKRINKIASIWVENVKNGEIEALKAYVLLRNAQDQIKMAVDTIKKHAIAEAERYGKEDIVIDNKKIAVQSRRSWSYKHISAWEAEKAKLIKIESIAKLASENGSAIIFDETGEFIEPATCKTSESLVLTEVKNV